MLTVLPFTLVSSLSQMIKSYFGTETKYFVCHQKLLLEEFEAAETDAGAFDKQPIQQQK